MTFHTMLYFGLGCLALLLAGVWRQRPWLLATGKAGASLALIGAAAVAPTYASHYGGRVFWALALAFVGDMLLLRDSKTALKLAIGVFMLGHLAYIDAFLHQGFVPARLGLALLAGLVPSCWVQMRLWPHVEAPLKAPVLLYLLIITAMLAATVGAAPYSVAPLLQMSGAALFYLSDVCVARDTFVVKSRINRIIGLPLYYAAQWLFVASLGY